MKTLEIKKVLKKDLLVAELPRLSNYTLGSRGLFVEDLETKENHVFKGSYTLLGKRDEICEEDAKEIVGELYCDNHWCEDGKIHQDYGVYVNCEACEDIHVKELLSAIETVVLWENPYAEPDKFIDGFDNPCYEWWQDAELRTFDRNRSIIFVTNQ